VPPPFTPRPPPSALRGSNLDAQRDWGHARDYVAAMWSMLQAATPEDYVIATGETRSVRVFCEAAFAAGGFGPLRWEGAGVDEVGIAVRSGATVVRVSERYHRPAEVELLIGDPSKAVAALGFNPRATSFQARPAHAHTPLRHCCTAAHRHAALTATPLRSCHVMPRHAPIRRRWWRRWCMRT
jgi:hypothetical protein